MSFSEWKEVKLGEVMDIIGGGTPKTKIDEYWNGDIPWLSVKDFNNGNRYVYTTEKTITELGLKNSSTKLLYKDDLIISARGTVGEIAQLGRIMAFNQSCYGLKAKKDLITSNFLYYLLRHSIKDIQSNTHGSVFDTITKETFNVLKANIPSTVEQKVIADTLSCLDDKIDLNNNINKTLEEMAQAIFKSWFVDFEPFQDGEFDGSELGKIPKGWKVDTLENHVISIDNRGKTPPLAAQMTIYPVIDVKSLSGESRIIDYNNCTKYVEEDTYNNWFRNGHPKQQDILISTVGSLAEMKLFYGDKGCIAQNVVGFRSKAVSPLYLYQYLKHIKHDLVSYNIGSVQPSIKVTHIIKHKILIPTDTELKSFESIISEISNMIFKNFRENQTLIAIRDALLPKLMSGEIRVPTENIQ